MARRRREFKLLFAGAALLVACGGTGEDSDRSVAQPATCDISKVPPIAKLVDPGSGPFSCPTPVGDPAEGYQYYLDVNSELQLDVIDDFETGAADGTWYTQNDDCWKCAKTQGLDSGTVVPNSLQIVPVLPADACLCRCQQSQLPRHFEKPVPAELIPGGGRCTSRYALHMRGGPFPDDGMKFASQRETNPVNAAELGYEGIAFWARIGGETGPSGLQASRNTLNLQVADIYTDEKAGLVVEEGGYVRSAAWHGYAFTAVSGAGNTVEPQDFLGSTARQPLCMSGSLVAAASPTDGAMLGIHVNQNAGESTWQTAVPTGSGLFVNYNGASMITPAAPTAKAIDPVRLRAVIQGPNGAVDPNDRWCASVPTTGLAIPWNTFNTRCWDNSGSYYTNQPLVSAAVMFLSAADQSGFKICLTSLSDGIAFCQANTPLNDTTQGCDKPNAYALLTSDWRFFTFPFAEMRQAGWGKKQPYLDLSALMSVVFHFGAGQWDVWIDDPAFYRRKAP